MAEQREFFVSYEGELTGDDRQALSRPAWKLYENGIGYPVAYRSGEPPPVKWRQVVRVRAVDSEEASRLVAEALGRQPERLHVSEAGPSEL